MNTLSKRRTALALAGGLVLSALVRRAFAAPLTSGERALLEQGHVVSRHVDVELDQGSYFGGVAYVIIHAPAAEVMRVLSDVPSYTHILPLALEARVVGKRGDATLVYFRHGGRKISAGYTALVRRESPFLVRFWLDPSHPHDIADCWGSFRVDPIDARRSVLTYSSLLRLDFGPIKLLFSEQIRDFALRTPDLVRRYVEARGSHR